MSQKIIITCLIIIYIVGFIGIMLPIHPQFILLTPLNLFFSMGMMLLAHPQPSLKLGLGLALCGLLGWLIELAGVQTGLLFGEYHYGSTLGFKIWGTPLVMGLNWAMLIYMVSGITYRYSADKHWIFRASVAATLMVFLDIWMEPVAVHYDFWHWKEAGFNALMVAPLQNYLFWWVAAFPLIALFQHFNSNFQNRVAEVLFILQWLFFMGLFICS